jgi:rhamnose utilization protein RhaD (predicted bifunctional aldolase and dehydrogenase)/NAD(P)-dependent dehydrogenase (short-subunit alcohol dehydrogenase family)
MKSRWSESEAAEFAALGGHTDVALLVYATRLLGAELDLAMHGGGNTSCKGAVPNVLGESTPALFVKASGANLATVSSDDFVALDLAYARRLVDVPTLSDEALANEYACHALRASGKRASVESLVHATLPGRFVLHTHPSAILALTNRVRGEETVTAALGAEVAVVPYTRAGLELAHSVRQTLEENPAAKAMLLLQHGLVAWGENAREAYDATIALVSRAEDSLAKSQRRSFAAPASSESDRERIYRSLAPVIRGVLGPTSPDALDERVVLVPLLGDDVVRVLDAPEGKQLALSAPLTPDYLVRTRRMPLWIDAPALGDAKAFRDQLTSAVDGYRDEYARYAQAHGRDIADWRVLSPRVLAVPGLGVVCIGNDAAQAHMVRDITLQGLRVKATIWQSGAEYLGLDDEHLFDMEFRAFQQAKVSGSGPVLDLRGTVALVTGAAGAIGSGICETLLARGCHVAASDLPGEPLRALVADLESRYPLRALAVAMDVTDAWSVAAAFAEVTSTWGGVDAVIVNAGIAHVAPLVELSLTDFRKLESVNVEGTLLTLAEAGRQLAVQGTGGDVVLVSTKNVFAPGAGFGAYSATKAASHQLARIASLEFAPLGVRVNMVAPDAVFSHGEKRSGLWAAVGPNRMKARGLDERGLEEYYRSRNLLKAPVTAAHVANAVLFFLTHQTPTTGATIPVDGGLPDATPR